MLTAAPLCPAALCRRWSSTCARPRDTPARAGRRCPRWAEPGARGEGSSRIRHHGRSGRRDGSGVCGRRLRDDRWGCRGRWSGRGGLSSGQEPERVDVAVGVVGAANAQMEVGARMLGLAARPERADRLAFGDDRSSGDAERPQMQERDRIAVGGLERHRPAVKRQGAGEANDAGNGRGDGLGCFAGDVYAAVLPSLVLAALVLERSQHCAGRGPAPGVCARRERERRDRDQRPKEAFCCQEREHDEQASGRVGCCQLGLQRVAVEPISRHARQPRDDLCCSTPRGSGRDQLGHGVERRALV